MDLTSQLNIRQSSKYLWFIVMDYFIEIDRFLHNRDIDNGLGVGHNCKSSEMVTPK